MGQNLQLPLWRRPWIAARTPAAGLEQRKGGRAEAGRKEVPAPFPQKHVLHSEKQCHTLGPVLNCERVGGQGPGQAASRRQRLPVLLCPDFLSDLSSVSSIPTFQL